MTLVEIVETLCEWLDEKVCSQVMLLDPDDDMQSADYEGLRVHPKAYPLFNPWQSASPEVEIPGAPGIIVSVLEGHDDLKKGLRTLSLQLQLISWNPGQYGRDIWCPVEDQDSSTGKRYVRKLNEWTYERSQSGWKDSYIFLETVLREFEKTETIHGMRIKLKENELTYGHYRDDTGPADLYPYWINYISLDVEVGLNRSSKNYQEYL